MLRASEAGSSYSDDPGILHEMEPSRSPSVRVVQDKESADVLMSPVTLRQLEPFLGREATVGQAAAASSEKPNTVLKRVQRFLGLGLLRVAREEPRAGRAIKVYRTTADVFFVPFEATSAESFESALAEREAYWEDQLRSHVVRARREAYQAWGTRIYRDHEGRLQVQMAVTPDRNTNPLDSDGPPALSAWRDQVWLDYEDAKALQRELFETLLRYQRKGGAQRYIVHAGLAPLRE